MEDLLRRAASDFWWTPDHVKTIASPELTICYAPDSEPLFNQAVPHQKLPDPIRTVEQVRELHGDASRWWITGACEEPSLIAALIDQGYAKHDEHFGYGVETAHYDIDGGADIEVIQVSKLSQMLAMHLTRSKIFGNPIPARSQMQLELSQCTGNEARVARFAAMEGDRCVATGSMTFFDELSFSFIWAGGVLESHRGRGIYKKLLSARVEACRQRGIQFMGLYGRTTTSAPILDAHGFERYGFLHYYELNPLDA